MSAALLSFIQGSYRSGKAGKSWVISLAKESQENSTWKVRELHMIE